MNPMSYFLLALTAVLAATATDGKIFDSNGDIIFGDSYYYVIPTLRGPSGGGLNLAIRHGNQCPLFIGQEHSNANRGIPVKFSNWMSRVRFVPESENLNIEMDVKATTCGQSAYWWVNAAPSPWRSLFITAGPKPEAGGENSARSFFQIKKVGVHLNAYQIAFCRDHDDCVDVGIKVDQDGVRRLIVGSVPIGFQPFVVMFVKATETETLSETMSII